MRDALFFPISNEQSPLTGEALTRVDSLLSCVLCGVGVHGLFFQASVYLLLKLLGLAPVLIIGRRVNFLPSPAAH